MAHMAHMALRRWWNALLDRLLTPPDDPLLTPGVNAPAAPAAPATPATPAWTALLQRAYAVLDGRVFPRIVSYATHRLHIVALLVVLVILMIDSDPVVQLKLGNYTNVTSALVACIVLLQQMAHRRETTAHHAENRALHQQHAEALATHQSALAELREQVAALVDPTGATATDGPRAVVTPAQATAIATATATRGRGRGRKVKPV